jgi:predicted CoA-binding protein
VTYQSEVLQRYHTVVVVGLSGDPERVSHQVARYMQEHGYKIIPVNPGETEILGERCYASLRDVPRPVELVDVFRRSEFCPDIARDAVAAEAKALWLQLGVSSQEAREIAESAGLEYVEDDCVMAVHRREIA